MDNAVASKGMATHVEASRLVLLLGARRHFRGQSPSPSMAARLARADRLETEPGELAQQRRPFGLRPSGAWPSAALIEALGRGDEAARPFAWLRADPVWLQPDLSTARLMAWGNLGLTRAEADALMAPMKPLFGDSGFILEARGAEEWVLQAPSHTPLPAFPHPLEALGDDAFPYLPQGADARRWRSLMGEAQVLMHQSPVNAERARRGLPPANSLWFWGGGILPDAVHGPSGHVATADPELAAYARAAGATVDDRIDATKPGLIDLRAERRWSVIDDLLALATAAMGQGAFNGVDVDFADGLVLRLRRPQRWRLWRRRFEGFGP